MARNIDGRPVETLMVDLEQGVVDIIAADAARLAEEKKKAASEE